MNAARLSGLLLAAPLAACGREEQQPSPPAAAARPPHILLVVADDLGWADVGFHGGEIATPNLDRLAREGVILDRFYVWPVCTPTRAALLTGRSPIRYGLAYGPLKPWDTHGLPASERILPEYLRAAGYRTALVGKWHLGHAQRSQHPNARGFDTFSGCLQGAIDHWTRERAGAVDWQRNGATVREKGYDTDLLAAEAVRLIEEHDPAQPLFLYLAFTAPHTPLQAPEDLVAKYEDLNPQRRAFCAMVEGLDAALGRVVAALERRGMEQDTLLWFASDNGGSPANGGRNAPLAGGKETTHEGGIRVPSLVRWPARIEPGRLCQQVIAAEDLLPTLAAAAGLRLEPPQPLDGRDMLAQILGAAPVPRGDLFLCTLSQSGDAAWYALLRGEWKLVVRLDREGNAQTGLFRVGDDPGEQRDLDGDEPVRVAEMLRALADWRGLQPGPPWRSYEPPAGWTPPRDWAQRAQQE